jgi:hypothetical protein
MAKTNALITKFKIEINGVGNFGSDIVSVGGLSLGEEGEIEVPERDRIALVSDGIKKHEPLTIKFRLVEGLVTFDFFLGLWNNRATENSDIAVIETRRDGVTELFRWVFTDCECKKLGSAEDLELGAVRVKEFDTIFAPNQVGMQKAGQTTT